MFELSEDALLITPLEKCHLYGASVNPFQKQYANILEGEPSIPEGWSVFYEDDLVAIGGSVLLDDKLGGWILFTDKISPKSFIRVHHFIKDTVASHKERGVVLVVHVDPDYEQAGRWAKLLGFEMIGTEDLQGRTMQRFEQ